MRRITILIAVILMLCAACALPATADDCTYFAENGTHDWVYGTVDATCEADGENYRECAVCGLRETLDVIPGGHDWAELETVTEPGCTTDGEKLYECSVCGEQKTEAIPALGHSYGEWETLKSASCSEEGQRTAVCENCGQQIYESVSRTSHDYGAWTVTVAPTDHSMGRRTRRCDECGASSEEYFYPEGTLYRGMKKNDDVAMMQQQLIDLGILEDKADGIFGKNTEQAVRDFQERHELEVTGVAYPQTLAAITEACASNAPETPENDYYSINGHPAYCMRTQDENGVPVLYYCEEHYAIVMQAAELETATYSRERAETLEKQFILWRGELNRLYDELVNTETGDECTKAVMSRKNFYNWLDSQEYIWFKVYDGDNAAVLERKKAAVIEQCIDICGILNK